MTIVRKIVPSLIYFPRLFWIALPITLIGGSIVFMPDSVTQSNDIYYFAICFGLTAATISVPWAFRFCYGVMRDWSSSINHFMVCDGESPQSWMLNNLTFLNGSKAMYLVSLCFGLLVTITVFSTELLDPYQDIAARRFLFAVLFITESWAGAGIFAVWKMTIVMRRLGQLPGCKVTVEPHKFGITSTGKAMLKCWFAASVVWMLFQAPVIAQILQLKSGQSVFFALGLAPIVGFTIPSIIIIFGSFVFSQIPLHQRMLDFKHEELRKLEALLEQIKPTDAKEISEDMIRKTEFLETRYVKIQRLPEWPFTHFAATGAITSAVMPVLLPTIMSEPVKQGLNVLVEKLST